jgi:hypothetical protein
MAFAVVLCVPLIALGAEDTATCVNNALEGLPSLGGRSPELLNSDSIFRSSFERATKGKNIPEWAKTLRGVAGPVKWFSGYCGAVALIKVCRPHWCVEETLVLIYVPDEERLWGRVVYTTDQRLPGVKVEMQRVLLGDPPPEVEGALVAAARGAN